MKIIITKIQSVTYAGGQTALVATMKDAEVGTLGGPGRSIFTVYNDSLAQAEADIQTKREYDIRNEKIVEGKEYEKNGKMIKSLWYKL
jgi:hypothetical protein